MYIYIYTCSQSSFVVFTWILHHMKLKLVDSLPKKIFSNSKHGQMLMHGRVKILILSKQGQCFLQNIIQVWVLIEGGLGYIITVFLQERYNEMSTTCNVDSLDSTHNSPQAFVQGVRDARMRVSAQFRRWCCTCSAQVHVSVLCS